MGIFLENTFGDVAVLKVYRQPTWLFSHATLLCRILGCAIMIGMWALMVAAFTGFAPVSGIWLLFLALLLTFQEFAWVFTRFDFLHRDNCIGTCWRMFVWVDSWKRSLEYLLIAVISFVIGAFASFYHHIGGYTRQTSRSIAFSCPKRRSERDAGRSNAKRHPSRSTDSASSRKIEPLQPANAAPGFTGVATAPPPPTQWGDQYGKY